MIISRTPFRISFFGGGTDYPVWYKEHGGAVLSTTIDKYCYTTLRYLPPFLPYKYRIVYSKVETVNTLEEILHPSINAALKFLKIDKGLELYYNADLPGKTGIGSSSAFAVGLLQSLYALKGLTCWKEKLAKEAIYIERDVLKENVGSQDQTAAAFGGLNKISFSGNDELKVEPVAITEDRKKELESHLMLFFTGFSRTASEVAKVQIENTPSKTKELNVMYQMVDASIKILCENQNILGFGKLLDETWRLKKSLSDKISNPEIDNIYNMAMKAGAVGGKILGAGGGGFILFFVEPHKQNNVRQALKGFLEVPFKFESGGSQIIYYNS
jgi:D-glycero-alpha-D-manno-heptose-7-phosphate kinase